MLRKIADGVVAAALATMAVAACLPAAFAQGADYPVKSITIVVPFPAGGPTDASARLFAKSMGEALGQVIVVDNRGGAAGTLGSGYVARSPADGYTLLWGGTSTLAVAPVLYKNLKYDSRSFVPIGMALRGPLMLAGRPSLEPQNFAALVAYAKRKPLTVGTAGNGSIGHFAAEYLREASGMQITHVPYRGGGPAITDALGGQIDLIFDTAAALAPYVKTGKLRAFAVTGTTAYAPTPEVPTVQSVLGSPFEAYSWFGLVTPAGTPPAAVRALIAAMGKTAASPEVRRELATSGVEPGVATPHEFAEVIDADLKKWAGVATRAHVHADE